MKTILATILFLMVACYVQAISSVTLAWNTNCSPSVAGYKIYSGIVNTPGTTNIIMGHTDDCGVVWPAMTNVEYRTYTNITTINGRSNSSIVISNLQDGTKYCFTITSFTADDLESTFGREVAYTTPGTPTNPPPATNIVGLVAAYSFNEGTGTIAKDSSTNGYDKTILGAAAWSTSGKYSNALSFDGVNDYINWGNTFSPTQFTLSVWIYPSNLIGWKSVVMKRNGFGMEINENILYSNIRGPGGSWSGSPSITVTLNTWQYVTQTYDGRTNCIYLNGVLMGQQTVTIEPLTENLLIGSWDTASEFFNGRMDEVRLYNKALSASEIVADMNTPIGTTIIPVPTAPIGLRFIQ